MVVSNTTCCDAMNTHSLVEKVVESPWKSHWILSPKLRPSCCMLCVDFRCLCATLEQTVISFWHWSLLAKYTVWLELNWADDSYLLTGWDSCIVRQWWHTIRDAVVTCTQKPTWVSLICCTKPTTTKWKTGKLKCKKNGYAEKYR